MVANAIEIKLKIPNTDEYTNTIVDIDDYKTLRNTLWHISKRDERMCVVSNSGKLMHRIIMGVTDRKIVVDHINGNPLDNRKENLRLCSQRENVINRRKFTNKYGAPGVTRQNENRKLKKMWNAKIRVKKGLRKSLGYFKSKEEAMEAYISASKLYHGEFSPFNVGNVVVKDVE